MLRFHVHNARERQQVEHATGPIEFGRGPRRGNMPRCMIQDGYVSKDHVRIEEQPTGELRIENLSTKQPILVGESGIPPGAWVLLRAPLRLGIGDSFIDIEFALPEEVDDQALKTIIAPLRGRYTV